MEMRKEPVQTEYMKIRKRLLGMIFKAGPEPVRLASSREMAKQFGVTHMTVSRVMKDLAEDGYLVIKPGIGTFASPKNNNVLNGARLFGLVVGDGKYAFFDRVEAKFFSSFMDAFLRFSERHWVQHYSILSQLDSSEQELRDANFEGLVWIMPHAQALPTIKALNSSGLPVFCAGRKLEGISSCRLDFERDNYQIAKRMLQEGRRKISLVLMEKPSFPQDGAEAGVEKAFAEFGLAYDKAWTVCGTEEERKSFGRILDIMKPDGMIFNDSIRPYWNDIKSRSELLASCRFYCEEWELRDDMGYKGLLGLRDLAGVAQEAAANLSLQIEKGVAVSVMDCALPLRIEEA